MAKKKNSPEAIAQRHFEAFEADCGKPMTKEQWREALEALAYCGKPMTKEQWREALEALASHVEVALEAVNEEIAEEEQEDDE